MSLIFVHSRAKGYFGEKIAKKYLTKQGYQILDTNYNTPYGEIDIISLIHSELVFVEVKIVKQYSPYPPISLAQQNRIKSSSQIYIDNHSLNFQNCRFDYIGIVKSYRSKYKIFHIKQAF